MSLVIDASAAACWCFADEATAASDALFTRVATSGAVVPALWHFEIGKMLRQAERRNRISEGVSQRQFSLIARLPIQIDEEAARQAWTTTMSLARLSAYGLRGRLPRSRHATANAAGNEG